MLKEAVAGSDIAALERAIAVAKEAGIGIKVARKRLAALEHQAVVQAALEAAVQGSAGVFFFSYKKEDPALIVIRGPPGDNMEVLRSAIADAKACDLPLGNAKERVC